MDDFGNSSTILLHASQPERTKHLKVRGIISFDKLSCVMKQIVIKDGKEKDGRT